MSRYRYPPDSHYCFPYLVSPVEKPEVQYAPIARVATRSVRLALMNMRSDRPGLTALPPWEDHGLYLNYINAPNTKELRKLSEKAWSFSIVRNPYSRVISFFRKSNKNAHRDNHYQKFGICDEYPPPPFDEFIEKLTSIPFGELENHLAPQHIFLRDEKGLYVDYIGHLERLGLHWKSICEKAGIKSDLDHLVESRDLGENKNYGIPAYMRFMYFGRTFPQPELSEFARRKIYEMYFTDFEIFGYTYDEQNPEFRPDPPEPDGGGYILPMEQCLELRRAAQMSQAA